MKRIIFFIFSICVIISSYAQSASELCETGRKAYLNGNYEEALVYLQKAADIGSPQACGLLGIGYMYGEFGGVQDLSTAFKWAGKGYTLSQDNPDPISIGVLGILGTALADSNDKWVENLNLLEYAYSHDFSPSYIGNLISTCYLLKGDKIKAKEWASKIRDKEVDAEDRDDYYMASAIIAKILMDSGDYFNAMDASRDAASYGNPLALYVMGRCQIEMDVFPQIGKQRVKNAALYDYSPVVDIKAFDAEIQKYYNSIKN